MNDINEYNELPRLLDIMSDDTKKLFTQALQAGRTSSSLFSETKMFSNPTYYKQIVFALQKKKLESIEEKPKDFFQNWPVNVFIGLLNFVSLRQKNGLVLPKFSGNKLEFAVFSGDVEFMRKVLIDPAEYGIALSLSAMLSVETLGHAIKSNSPEMVQLIIEFLIKHPEEILQWNKYNMPKMFAKLRTCEDPEIWNQILPLLKLNEDLKMFANDNILSSLFVNTS